MSNGKSSELPNYSFLFLACWGEFRNCFNAFLDHLMPELAFIGFETIMMNQLSLALSVKLDYIIQVIYPM